MHYAYRWDKERDGFQMVDSFEKNVAFFPCDGDISDRELLSNLIDEACRAMTNESQKRALIKTQNAQPMGIYKETATDRRRKEVDFILLDVNPYLIRWKDGRRETVTYRKLKQLQKSHDWMTDF
jgi:arabinogalactan endo-1,4-beta-galactosidase